MRSVTCLNVQPGSKQGYESSYRSEYTGQDLGKARGPVTCFNIQARI